MKIDVKIRLCDGNAPVGKLANAEVHFLAGALQGLKLVGFAVWQRRDGNGCSVTFPSRQFIVHGERRNFSLLRAISDSNAQDNLRELVLQTYLDCEREPHRLAS